MAPTAPLIDDHVSQAQAKKAVDSLLAYAAKARVEKEGTELIEKEENVWLVVATKTIQPAHKLKPTKMYVSPRPRHTIADSCSRCDASRSFLLPLSHPSAPPVSALPNPLIDPRTTSICLLVKDPQREYKDLLASSNIKFVSRVVGVEKLRGKFKPFEARRELLKEHGMFLADERIVPLLPKLLGKGWFEAKKSVRFAFNLGGGLKGRGI
jgi:ribosome biogenesis protein UTP30